jgi:hypothetical protein
LGVPVPVKAGTSNAYERGVVGRAFPDLHFVTSGHTVAGKLAFQIFKGDRYPAITVTGRDQNQHTVWVTWRIDLGSADQSSSA